MITENLSTLKIHKLTQEQYNRELASSNIDANALYLTPDEGIKISDVSGLQSALNGKVSNTESGMTALFASGVTVLSANQYGDTLPSAGVKGRIFFKKVSD